MKAIHIYILIGMAAWMLTGCVKRDLYDTSHPDTGLVCVTAEWSQRGEGVAVPASWCMALGDYSGRDTAATHFADRLFAPGHYTLVAYSPATDISVSGTTATVAATADGRLSGTPGWLFTAVQPVSIEADRVHAFTAIMQQQVRQLTLTIHPTGDAAVRIAGISATLSGVAATMDFATGTYGDEGTVELHFTKVTEGGNAGAWTATVRLLGIAGEAQRLTGRISYAGDSPTATPLVSDMTARLADFNTDKSAPLALTCDIATPTEAGIAAVIDDWQLQETVDVDIK